MAAASVVFSLATLALAFVKDLAVLSATMVAAGVAWMVVTSGLNVVVQACAPSWVRARALATFLLVFQGTLAAGSLLWVFAADRLGDPLWTIRPASMSVMSVRISGARSHRKPLLRRSR